MPNDEHMEVNYNNVSIDTVDNGYVVTHRKSWRCDQTGDQFDANVRMYVFISLPLALGKVEELLKKKEELK